jgi:hypothetical protein
MNTQSWIRSKSYDLIFILSIPFLCVFLLLLFPNYFSNDANNNALYWFILVVCIDVGHVYSTIFRTYLDKQVIQNNRTLFILSPILLYVLSVLLYNVSSLLYWRCLAYLAIFHFIRQQYGFMRLYARKDIAEKWSSILDSITIYAATLYPIIYWHLNGKAQFNWFVSNDLIYINKPELIIFFNIVYLIILLLYVCKESYSLAFRKSINIPKNLLIIGTIISWYLGIVYFNGDLIFTLFNIACHGIPYFALVWAFGNKRVSKENSLHWIYKVFIPKYLIGFIVFLIAIAYLEELLWDGLVWREHFAVFPTSFILPDLSQYTLLLNFVVPLLAMPQLLHYFIDGFIWKINKDKLGWTGVLLNK